MKENTKNLVMSLLQNYRASKRKIEQLRYELEQEISWRNRTDSEG